MEANCKRVVETVAPQQESHDVTEPIGPLGSIHNLSRGWAMMISLFFPFFFLKPPLIISGVFF